MKLRRLLATLSLWAPALVIVVTWGIWADRLPKQLPTHWGASGPADAATSAPVVFWWLFGVAMATAAVGTVLLARPLTGRWVQRAIGGIAGAVAAFVMGVWLSCTVPALGVADPYTVELGPWLLIALALYLYGLIPLCLLPKGTRPPVELTDAPPIAAVHIAEGERVTWSRTLSSRLFIAVAILMLALVIVLLLPVLQGAEAVGSLLFGGVVAVAALLLVVALCAFRVTIDERGLRVRSLTLGVAIGRIPLSEIATVEAAELEPTHWGGWGYRVMPGRSALILRRGPGLVITRRDQRQFAITLNRPEEPAAILLGLMQQQGAGKRPGAKRR